MAYPGQTRTTLGQLCAALWGSQSRPDVIQPGFEPGTVATPLAQMQCLRPLRTMMAYLLMANLNAQTYRDEILRTTVVPFIRRHHLMFQHDNAQPHVARVCTQFLEAENVMPQFFHGLPTHMPPIEHFWSSCRQYPATSHRHWRVGQDSPGHNQQPDHPYVKEMSRCIRYWLVFWATPLLSFID